MKLNGSFIKNLEHLSFYLKTHLTQTLLKMRISKRKNWHCRPSKSRKNPYRPYGKLFSRLVSCFIITATSSSTHALSWLSTSFQRCSTPFIKTRKTRCASVSFLQKQTRFLSSFVPSLESLLVDQKFIKRQLSIISDTFNRKTASHLMMIFIIVIQVNIPV